MDPSTPNIPNPTTPQPPAGGVPDGAYVVNPQAVPANPATAVQPTGLPRSETDRYSAPGVPMAPTVPAQPVPGQAAPPPVPPTQTPALPQTMVASPPPAGAKPNSKTAEAKPVAHPNSTQNSLQIAEVRDGIVIMNDGSFRSVVMVKSINFDLMSPQEQEAVEHSYQSFLNSLYFPVQIFIRSQKVDLGPYIQKLSKIRSEHDNMLLALLMEDYIGYIGDLSQQTNIMDKNFYVVIPFFPVIDAQKALTQSKNFLSGLGGLFSKKEQHVVVNEADLENAKTELRNRVQSVLAGMLQCGIQGLPLDTQELIELYYDTYNPDTATRQQLKDFSNLTADVITKGQGSAPQPHLQRELQ